VERKARRTISKLRPTKGEAASELPFTRCDERISDLFEWPQDAAFASAKALMVDLLHASIDGDWVSGRAPPDRREASSEVRRGINRALPPGYKEAIQFGGERYSGQSLLSTLE